MRAVHAMTATLMMIAGTAGAQAQSNAGTQREDSENVQRRDGMTKSDRPEDARARCATMGGVERSRCLAEAKRAAKSSAESGGLGEKDVKLVNETRAAAEAKQNAGDLAGGAAVYQQAVAGAPAKSPVLPQLLAGLANAQRRQGVAAYNAGGQPTYPPPGATNEQIRAANAANAALQAQKASAAVPVLRQALTNAARAAALTETGKDHSLDQFLQLEMREDAGLLYRIDRDAVFATPRDLIDTEVAWFTRWFDATTPLAETLAAKYGVPVAAGLTAKDKAAGLALADKVRAKTGSDVDGLIGYAEVVLAAKVPPGDARRTKALADLTAAEPTIADGAQAARVKKLKAALAAAS